MFRRISRFMGSQLSKQQHGFKKDYSPQYCLLLMLEKWKNPIGNGKCFGALLTDLSKAFVCLFHKLSIAKLHAHGFDLLALKIIQSSYQTEKKGPKLMSYIAHGKKFYLGYSKDRLFII